MNQQTCCLREGLKWKARSAARTWNVKPDPQRSEGARPIYKTNERELASGNKVI